MAEHDKAKMLDSLSLNQPPGALLRSHAAMLPAPLPVGPVGDTSRIYNGRRPSETDQDFIALAKQLQKLQMRAEQLDRSEDELVHSNNSRTGIDIEGLGTQLRALASGSTSGTGSLGFSNRGGGLTQARPGFNAAAIEAAVAEHWRLNPLLAAAVSSRGGAAGSDSKGQKGRGLKSSVPQNGKSSYSHAAHPPVLSAPPGTWAMQGAPPRPWFFVAEAPRVRAPKNVESGSQAPVLGWHRDQLGGRAVAHSRRTAPTSNFGDRRVENAETVQRPSKGYSATNVPTTGMKRPSKGREKQPYPVARKDDPDAWLKVKFKRCRFAIIQENTLTGENTLMFSLRAEDLQERLHPETLEGEPLCAEDEALAASSPWEHG